MFLAVASRFGLDFLCIFSKACRIGDWVIRVEIGLGENLCMSRSIVTTHIPHILYSIYINQSNFVYFILFPT